MVLIRFGIVLVHNICSCICLYSTVFHCIAAAMPCSRGLAYRSKCGTGRETHKPARCLIGLQSPIPNLCYVNDHNVHDGVMHHSSDGDRRQECLLVSSPANLCTLPLSPPGLCASTMSVDICFEGEQLQGGKTCSKSNHHCDVEECKW